MKNKISRSARSNRRERDGDCTVSEFSHILSFSRDFWLIWIVLVSSITRHQIHYASGEDELERCGFIKKSKARVAKHDDQGKHEDEKE